MCSEVSESMRKVPIASVTVAVNYRDSLKLSERPRLAGASIDFNGHNTEEVGALDGISVVFLTFLL